MAKPLHYGTIRAEMALTAGSGDVYGWAMGWWFAIAGRLYDDGETIPDEWHYRPSPFGGADPDGYEDQTLAELCIPADALLYAGKVLARYVSACKRKGLDY